MIIIPCRNWLSNNIQIFLVYVTYGFLGNPNATWTFRILTDGKVFSSGGWSLMGGNWGGEWSRITNSSSTWSHDVWEWVLSRRSQYLRSHWSRGPVRPACLWFVHTLWGRGNRIHTGLVSGYWKLSVISSSWRCCRYRRCRCPPDDTCWYPTCRTSLKRRETLR